jgi:hypothetical protein
MRQSRSSGQVVLITLLVLTIATTVALSLISRTTTDTSITNLVEESSRAFSAAEAGIEEALTGISTGTTQVLTPGVNYTVNVMMLGGVPGLYEFPKKIQAGTTETLWLVRHDTDTGALVETPTYTAPSLDVCWSQESPAAALVLTLLYIESTDQSYRTVKIPLDPDTLRAQTNKFDSNNVSGGCGADTGTAYRKTISFSALNPSINPAQDVLLALRIRPVYNNTKVVIDTDTVVLPQQGNRIESTGTTGTGTNRKIMVYQQYRSAASVFDAALYSQSTISH